MMNVSISGFILDRTEEIACISQHFEENRSTLYSSPRNKKRTSSYKVFKKRRLQKCSSGQIVASSKHLLKLKRIVVYKKNLHRFLRRGAKNILRPINKDSNYLSTHIWHAKRFSMTKEGSIYRAAVHRGRGFKSSQWASRKHSVIQDISFHQVIVIHCNDCFQEIISDIRKHLLVPSNDLFHYGSAVQEMESLLFGYDKFPFDCIGKVIFCIPPKEFSSILIWAPPMIVRRILNELQMVIEKLENPAVKTPLIKLLAPKLELNRFSMKGPHAATALKNLLTTNNIAAVDPAIAFFVDATQSPNLSAIWKSGSILAVNIPDPRILCGDGFSNGSMIQSDTLDSSPKCGSKNDKIPQQNQRILWPGVPVTPSLWEVVLRFRHLQEFRLDNLINNEKRSLSNMSWMAHFVDDASKVVADRLAQESLDEPFWRNVETAPTVCPALLVRTEQNFSKRLRKGCAKQSIFSGWDIIIPSEWGATIWRALQMQGIVKRSDLRCSRVYAVGEEEMQDINRLHGSLSFPKDFPYTDGGRQYWAGRFTTETADIMKRPHGKRKGHIENMEKILHSIIAWNKPDILLSEHLHDSNIEGGCRAARVEIQDIVVVRGESYLRDFLPPEVTPALRKEIEQTSNLSETFHHPVNLLASGALVLPNRVFLQVRLLSIKGSRGLPLDMAKLISPFEVDYIRYSSYCRELREQRRVRQQATDASRKRKPDLIEKSYRHWTGVRWTNKSTVDGDGLESFDSRPVVGVVTSGYKPHTNKLDGSRGEFSYAIGLCNAAALNHMFCSSFTRYRDELTTAHYLALYCNPCSGWLRPCLLQIM